MRGRSHDRSLWGPDANRGRRRAPARAGAIGAAIGVVLTLGVAVDASRAAEGHRAMELESSGAGARAFGEAWRRAPSGTPDGAPAPRIAAGRPAAPGEQPFTVFVDILSTEGPSACSGTLIAREWVLSAAHCVTDDEGAFREGLDVLVGAGITDLDAATPANVFAVADLFVPIDYRPAASRFANDYALMRLDRASPHDGLPLMTPLESGFARPETPAWIGGWGLLGESPDTADSRLHVGATTLRSDEDCAAYFGEVHVPALMLCTGAPPGSPAAGATTCPGDSGGPLYVSFGTAPLQAGVTSFGPSPCQLWRTGGYTRLSAYASPLVDLIRSEQPEIGPPVATTGLTDADPLVVGGTIDVGGMAANYEVAWGTTPDLATGRVRGYAGTGATRVHVRAAVTGVAPGDTVHYRLSALSAAGRSDGATESAIAPVPTSSGPIAPVQSPTTSPGDEPAAGGGPAEPAGPARAGQATAPSAQRPACRPRPYRRPSPKGTIELTRSALAIQQRIDAAALRRLNAANAWIDRGIQAGDLCGDAFGPNAFAAGIAWSTSPDDAPGTSGPPLPRPVGNASPSSPSRTSRFDLTLRQVRINDRISRALAVRARATWARINGLTGGNLAPTTRLSGRPLYAGLVAASIPLDGTEAPPTPLAIGRIDPPRGLRLTAAQLRTTQRRSQRAVVLANRVNDLISAGLTEDHFRSGSIGAHRLR